MHVGDEDLKEFRRLYQDEFGEELSEEEASEMASRVADLYALLAEPLSSERRSATMPPPEEPQLPSRE